MSGGLLRQTIPAAAAAQTLPPTTTYGLPAGWVSVEQYGAPGRTAAEANAAASTDDTAFATALATGAHVYVPLGTLANPKFYVLSQTITPARHQIVAMPNKAYPINEFTYTTFLNWLTYTNGGIIFVGTTNFAFQLNHTYAKCQGITVIQHPSYVPTAGGHFSLGTTVNVLCYEPTAIDCISANAAYVGFLTTGPQSVRSTLNDSAAYGAILANFHINHNSGLTGTGGDLQWNNIKSGWAAGTGVLVDGCDTSRITNLSAKGGNLQLHLRGLNSSVSSLKIVASDFEDSGYWGTNTPSIIVGGGTYPVRRNSFTEVEFLGQHIQVQATNAWDNSFDVCDLKYSRIVDLGTLSAFRGNKINGTGYAYNAPIDPTGVTSGIGLDCRGKDTIVATNTVSNFHDGIVQSAASTDATFTANNAKYNVIPWAIAGTGKGRGNINITDWG